MTVKKNKGELNALTNLCLFGLYDAASADLHRAQKKAQEAFFLATIQMTQPLYQATRTFLPCPKTVWIVFLFILERFPN